MSEEWSSYVQLGIGHPMIYPEFRRGGDKNRLVSTLRRLSNDVFFGAIEITWYQGADDSTRREMRNLLNTSGMEVTYDGGIPVEEEGIDLSSEVDEARELGVRRVKELIDDAYFYDARILHILSGSDPGEELRAREKAIFVDSVKTLCRYAAEKATSYTLCLALENCDRAVDLRKLIGPTREALEVVKAVSSEYSNFGLLIDTSHLALLGESFEEAVSIAIEYLVQVHFANCIYSAKAKNHPYYGDRHPRFCIQDGEYDLEDVTKFITHLAKVGYFEKKTPTSLPLISIDTKPMEHEDSQLVLAHEKRVFQQAWFKYQRIARSTGH